MNLLMRKISGFIAVFALVGGLGATAVSAFSLTEDFEAQFPVWEMGWFGLNSNVQNYYGVGQYRGNNPDGLWLDDGDNQTWQDTVEIKFNPFFGSSLTSLSFDMTTWIQDLYVQIYDSNNNILLNSYLAPTYGAYTDPGTYDNFFVSSSNGISGFTLFSQGSQVEGNTSIDNIVVTQGATGAPLPVAPIAMGITTLLSGGILFRRKK